MNSLRKIIKNVDANTVEYFLGLGFSFAMLFVMIHSIAQI